MHNNNWSEVEWLALKQTLLTRQRDRLLAFLIGHKQKLVSSAVALEVANVLKISETNQKSFTNRFGTYVPISELVKLSTTAPSVCLDPNQVNPQFCVFFEAPHRCHKEAFCNFKKGLDLKSQRKHEMTRNPEEINP